MLERVRAASVAVDTKPGEIAENLRKIDQWSGRAKADGAQLVLFQELSLCGFIPNHPIGDHSAWLREALRIAGQIAEPIPGSATDALVAIAAKHNLLVCAGLLEEAGPVLHNTQVLVTVLQTLKGIFGDEGDDDLWEGAHAFNVRAALGKGK